MTPPAVTTTIRLATAAELTRLGPLWLSLYEHQAEHGMLIHLPDQAYDAWVKSLAPLLGRFAAIVLAENQGQLIGFVAGRIRTMPPYFGGGAAGFISEVFLLDTYRGSGIGRRMIEESLNWFRQQGVARVELQVVSGNQAAIDFYRKLGWYDELRQMVWNFPPTSVK